MRGRGGAASGVAGVTVNVHGRFGTRIDIFLVEDGGFTSAHGPGRAVFAAPRGGATHRAAAPLGNSGVAAAVHLTMGAGEGPGRCTYAEGGRYEVSIPDREARHVRVDVCCRAMVADKLPEPATPFSIQNLCGSQHLRWGLDLQALRPVLTRRKGATAGRLEILTPSGTLTFRKSCTCVDFKGARGIAALRRDLAAATGGPAVHDGPPRVYMAVLRGALGRMLDLTDPERNYVANMAERWCTPRHGVDGLNELPTLDLKDVVWDAMMPDGAWAASPLLPDLRAGKTRFKLSRRGWVLMYTIFPDGGVPWGEEAEASLLCLANAGLRRLQGIASGRELPTPRAEVP